MDASKKISSGKLPLVQDLMRASNARKSSFSRPLGYSLRSGSELFAQVASGRASLAAVLTHSSSSSAAGRRDGAVRLKAFGAEKAHLRSSRDAKAAGAEFSTAGGMNLPRIVWCYGDNGQQYKQLVKGHDDMRGDAIMQQVFELVNVILAFPFPPPPLPHSVPRLRSRSQSPTRAPLALFSHRVLRPIAAGDS